MPVRVTKPESHMGALAEHMGCTTEDEEGAPAVQLDAESTTRSESDTRTKGA